MPSIKRHEQEELSLLRTEVAPAFVFNNKHKNVASSNRFGRECEFCQFVTTSGM